MPKKNGYEATAEIPGINPDAIIIMQSTFAMQGESENVTKPDARDILPNRRITKSSFS